MTEHEHYYMLRFKNKDKKPMKITSFVAHFILSQLRNKDNIILLDPEDQLNFVNRYEISSCDPIKEKGIKGKGSDIYYTCEYGEEHLLPSEPVESLQCACFEVYGVLWPKFWRIGGEYKVLQYNTDIDSGVKSYVKMRLGLTAF